MTGNESDYYRILRKAVDRLEPPDKPARASVYQRARQALANQLRGSDGLTQAEVEMHAAAFDAAVARIEREFSGEQIRRSPPPLEPQAPAALAAPWWRGGAAAIAAVIGAFLVAGLVAYYIAARDRPAQAVRADAVRPAPAAAGSRATPALAAEAEQGSYVLRRQRVYYRTTQPVGAVIVSRNQKFLYVVQPNSSAIRYAIGVGRECENLAGLFHIIEKVDQPAPGKARYELPAFYFDGDHAVHKAATPGQVGQSTTVGCFQAGDGDMVDLFGRVPLNERVVVAN